MNELSGHELSIREVDVADLQGHGDALDAMYEGRLTGVVVRGAFAEATARAAAERMTALPANEWGSPNRGMPGGEVRVIGEAATPTMTALKGPTFDVYSASAALHAQRTARVFGHDFDAPARLSELLGALGAGRPASQPGLTDDSTWAAFNFRALDPGIQIYSHHDAHFGLAIYDHMDQRFDRTTLLSYFVTVQRPDVGGKLVVYGLRGSDPDPPMLPTRFLDTEVLEARYHRRVFELNPGDLIVFDSGRHVHRVTPVAGALPRMTIGGFLTLDRERTQIAYWA